MTVRSSQPAGTPRGGGARFRRRVIVAWLALVAGATALALAARGAGPLPGDLLASNLLQGLPVRGTLAGVLLPKADVAVWLMLVAALAVTLLLRDWSSAAFIFLASLTSLLLGIVLKRIVARPRPSAELVHVHDAVQGYSFPSTTAFLSVVLLGAIVYLLWQARSPRPVLVVALGAVASAFVLAIGLSRVYAGEHWASDVLGAWLFGAAWLLAFTSVMWSHVWDRE